MLLELHLTLNTYLDKIGLQPAKSSLYFHIL